MSTLIFFLERATLTFFSLYCKEKLLTYQYHGVRQRRRKDSGIMEGT